MPAKCLPALFLSIFIAGCGTYGSLRDGPSDEAGWQFFPNNRRVFAPALADPREAQFRLGFLFDGEGDFFQDMVWGGDLSAFYLRTAAGAELSLSARGLMTARFDFISESFDLQNVDFIGGGAAAFAWNDWAVEAFIYHQSSHLGDEIVNRGDRDRVDFGHEAARLLASYATGAFRFYLGPSVIIRAIPSNYRGKVTGYAGVELSGRIRSVPVYAAADAQLRFDDWSKSRSTLQLGLELGDPEVTTNRQRIFVELFNGSSYMGQFYDQHERYILLGAAYCFR